MAPLTSDLIHQFSGGTLFTMVVEGSVKVMHMLVASPEETGAGMGQEISNNKEAKQAIGILIQLNMETKSTPTFIKILGDIFVARGSRDMSIRKLADEALVKLCLQSGNNTGFILQMNDVKNKTCRKRAAEILEHMCNIHHTQYDECLNKLKEAMTTTIPKIICGEDNPT
uniref:Uncharacterized protein n=1 Tax=Aegilops tauschii TaxID=37682 RepID=M8B4E9_AEGTA